MGNSPKNMKTRLNADQECAVEKDVRQIRERWTNSSKRTYWVRSWVGGNVEIHKDGFSCGKRWDAHGLAVQEILLVPITIEIGANNCEKSKNCTLAPIFDLRLQKLKIPIVRRTGLNEWLYSVDRYFVRIVESVVRERWFQLEWGNYNKLACQVFQVHLSWKQMLHGCVGGWTIGLVKLFPLHISPRPYMKQSLPIVLVIQKWQPVGVEVCCSNGSKDWSFWQASLQ